MPLEKASQSPKKRNCCPTQIFNSDPNLFYESAPVGVRRQC